MQNTFVVGGGGGLEIKDGNEYRNKWHEIRGKLSFWLINLKDALYCMSKK